MTSDEQGRVTRRRLLLGGSVILLAAGLPDRGGAQPKIAQKLVQYQEKPKDPQECDNCLHFVAPAACGDIGASGRAGYAGRFDRVSARGAAGLAPGDSRWAQTRAGVAA